MGRPILGELDVVASYYDDDAVVSAISLIFIGIAEPYVDPRGQHLCILLGLLISRLADADVAVYRSGCTEIVHILTGLCNEVV